MMIQSATAAALASIMISSTQGSDSLKAQLPLEVIDKDDSWLVKGTPYKDPKIGSQYIACYFFIKKNSGEVVGFGSDARTRNRR